MSSIAEHKIAVVIVAAGYGTRYQSKLPKQYDSLFGKPVLLHSLGTFLAHTAVNKVVCLISAQHRDLYEDAINQIEAVKKNPKLLPSAEGGVDRQQSVYNGLQALTEFDPDYVLIHDAARTGVSDKHIDALIQGLRKHKAVCLAVPSTDTLSKVGSDRMLGETLDRNGIWRLQTPQAFNYSYILDLHEKYCHFETRATDDTSLCKRENDPVLVVEGSVRNTKLTTQHDKALLEGLMTGSEVPNMAFEFRTGQGFDVHIFGENVYGNDSVILCGVSIPHTSALAGHSDADVGLHALTDALLGAIGEGDIGQHFPPSDPQWAGKDSRHFVRHVVNLIEGRSAKIANVDITLICEAPKLFEFKASMEEKVAEILDIAIDRVNVKATTTEKLGFTGRREGIAAMAAVSVAIPSTLSP